MLVNCSCTNAKDNQKSNANNMDKTLYPFQDESNKWGYMDDEGNVVIKPQYASASNFTDNIAVVTIESRHSYKYGYINKAGEVVVPIVYDWAAPYSDNLFFVKSMKNSRADHGGETWIYMNENGETVLELTDKDYYQVWPVNGGFSIVTKGDGMYCGCIDITGDYVIQPQYGAMGGFRDGFAWFTSVSDSESRYGYINKNNEIVIPEMYELPGQFSQGVTPVKLNGKWGYINENNEIIITFMFEEAKSFSENVAVVKENGLWGVINHMGEYVLLPQYPNLSDSYNGLFMVQKNIYDFHYYVNINGEIIKPKS